MSLPAEPGAERSSTLLAVLLILMGAGTARLSQAQPGPAAAPLPAPEVTVALPAGEVTVGDRAEAVVTLRVPAARLAAEPRFPVWRDAWGEAEVREHGEPRRSAGAGAGRGGGPADIAIFSQRLVLAAFRTGKVELPPVAIAVPLRSGTVQAWTPAGLALGVRSVLPGGVKDLHPRPPAPLRPLPLGTAFFVALGVLAAAAAAGIWVLWRRGQRHRVAAPAARPPLAPLAELLAALDRLAAGSSPLALHTGISQALRRYLGRTLAFPAPESTTSEIQRRLVAGGWPAAQLRPAVELLRACDLVKFARLEVGEARGRERLGLARRLGEDFEAQAALDETRARLGAAG